MGDIFYPYENLDDLAAGITFAVQNSRPVICFVREQQVENASTTSDIWEDWLDDRTGQLADHLNRDVLILEIVNGSQEADFLSKSFGIEDVPEVLVIHKGKVTERLKAGISQDDFYSRLLAAIQHVLSSSSSSSSSSTAAPPRSPAAQTPGDITADATPVSSSSTNPRLQEVLAERKKRLDADKQAKELAEKERLEAVNKKRREAVESSAVNKTAEVTYAQQVAKQKKQAEQDKQRILKQLEQDKIERKEREAYQRSILAEQRRLVEEEKASTEPVDQRVGRRGCALQIRLLDGSTLRSHFVPEATISKDVRQFIDKHRDADSIPYTLKQILTPLPNRNIHEVDETKGLRELGLTPSATLVLVPVIAAVDAYPLQPRGIVGNFLVGVWNWIASLVVSLLRLIGLQRIPAQEAPQNEANLSAISQKMGAGSATMRIRTLHDGPDGKENQQMYNGNQLNFEPKKADDDEEDPKKKR